MTRSMVFSMLLTLFASSNVEARLVRIWTYQDLLKRADVVVVASASESKVTEYTDAFRHDYLLQMKTTLDVQSVLKGELMANEQLNLVHFRMKEGVGINNGPQLVHFRTGENRPSYLLFLNRREDGQYEAVTGQMDPVLSVKLLATPN